MTLPSTRLVPLTAEVMVDKKGAAVFYVYAAGRCIDQGSTGAARDDISPVERCAAFVRERWRIEPAIVRRK